MTIKRIEIDFPFEVELPSGFEHTLECLVGMVCKKYEQENPLRSMWPAHIGAKILWPIDMSQEPGHDDSVFCIGVSEKEASKRTLERRGIKVDDEN